MRVMRSLMSRRSISSWLSRPAEEADATALPFQVGPGPDKTAALEGQGRELHLKSPLMGTGAGAEDLQDQGRSVDDLTLPSTLKIALLNRG